LLTFVQVKFYQRYIDSTKLSLLAVSENDHGFELQYVKIVCFWFSAKHGVFSSKHVFA